MMDASAGCSAPPRAEIRVVIAEPRVSGLDALRQLAAAGLLKALQLGVRGVVFKDADPDLLLKSIHHVMSGQYWVGRERVGDLVCGA